MLRATYRIAVLTILVAAGSFGYWYFHNPASPAMRIQRLEQDKKELQAIVQRLTDQKRVAQFVARPRRIDSKLQTDILFEERDAKNNLLQQKSFTIEGDEVHIDALSIRFMDDFVMKNDPLRGHGLVLFTRLYGAHQAPAQGYAIDDPGQAPRVYRDAQQPLQQSDFEKELWQNFWRLVDDKSYRLEKGVEVASGKGVWDLHVEANKLYTISLDAQGNPTLDWEPIPPILQEALKMSSTRQSANPQ